MNTHVQQWSDGSINENCKSVLEEQRIFSVALRVAEDLNKKCVFYIGLQSP